MGRGEMESWAILQPNCLTCEWVVTERFVLQVLCPHKVPPLKAVSGRLPAPSHPITPQLAAPQDIGGLQPACQCRTRGRKTRRRGQRSGTSSCRVFPSVDTVRDNTRGSSRDEALRRQGWAQRGVDSVYIEAYICYDCSCTLVFRFTCLGASKPRDFTSLAGLQKPAPGNSPEPAPSTRDPHREGMKLAPYTAD